MTKVFIWISVFMFNVSIAFAQTGLFDTVTLGTFATTGVTIVVIIIIARELFKQFFKKKE